MTDQRRTFRVIEINLRTGQRRIVATGKSERDADDIAAADVVERGVGDEFYTTEPER